ncbi:MAG: cyclopropane-fatty-acyl-phospholipid synthase family protein [Phenylobacterium sp.]|uniref:SAM-dependent methyltransferase n=1 Tax=Phenylobacterium sp. TaxID=1871053 RepID=UPI002721FAA7|nr:cyclopropane-fatty-acyl-phospholipid synthase family protein [Phenylobacterium sp.]MDO8411784.1 cyclopropane-fatty-acyl-phospholipid synthase family protein [Phenylobacterium sp.]
MTIAHDSSSLADLAHTPGALRRAPELSGSTAAFRSALGLLARNWTVGKLTFVLPNDKELTIVGPEPGPSARLVVRDYAFMNRVLSAGDIGFAEGFMAQEWDTPDMAALLCAFSLNFDKIERLALGAPLMWVLNRILHVFRDNSRAGAKKNIHAHYDLGNAFYSRWLDATMTYSAARFDHEGQDLAQAQQNKYRLLTQQMALEPKHHVLEIGCGWGGFAEYAAKTVGAKVTAITISKEQCDFAAKRMFDQGLSERAEIRLVDYRDVDGTYDRVASIEMFEAVGEKYWPSYFSKIAEVLKPGGQAGLQIITIQDEFFEAYRRRADFIQRYIFPGGMLISEARLRQETTAAGLAWRDISRFGQDYADTLAEWTRRFEAAWPEIRQNGFDERFRRLWRFYLAYCEAGFRTERTDVVQLSLSKS